MILKVKVNLFQKYMLLVQDKGEGGDSLILVVHTVFDLFLSIFTFNKKSKKNLVVKGWFNSLSGSTSKKNTYFLCVSSLS